MESGYPILDFFALRNRGTELGLEGRKELGTHDLIS